MNEAVRKEVREEVGYGHVSETKIENLYLTTRLWQDFKKDGRSIPSKNIDKYTENTHVDSRYRVT